MQMFFKTICCRRNGNKMTNKVLIHMILNWIAIQQRLIFTIRLTELDSVFSFTVHIILSTC